MSWYPRCSSSIPKRQQADTDFAKRWLRVLQVLLGFPSLLCHIPEERGANLYLSFEEVELPRELVWVRGAYQYTTERSVEGRDEIRFWRNVASVYQQRLGLAFFVERVAGTAHRGHVTVTEFSTFARASGDILQSPDYPYTLRQRSLGEFLEFLSLTLQGEDESLAKVNRTL